MLQSLRALLLIFALLPMVSGCGHTPVTKTVAEAIAGSKNIDAARLDPNLRYLRVTVGSRTALMVLGYAERSAEGEVQTWYSNAGEMLKIRDGRIIATGGLETDWRSVRYIGLPPWTALAQPKMVEFERIRDEMPGYRFNISTRLGLSTIDPPNDSKLMGIAARQLRWFEERELDSSGQAQTTRIGTRPPVRYALRADSGNTVIYGEQCLSEKLCLTWQTWPASQ